MHKGQLASPSALYLSRHLHAGARGTRNERVLSWPKAHILSRNDIRNRVLGRCAATTTGSRMRDHHIPELPDGWDYSARTTKFAWRTHGVVERRGSCLMAASERHSKQVSLLKV